MTTVCMLVLWPPTSVTAMTTLHKLVLWPPTNNFPLSGMYTNNPVITKKGPFACSLLIKFSHVEVAVCHLISTCSCKLVDWRVLCVFYRGEPYNLLTSHRPNDTPVSGASTADCFFSSSWQNPRCRFLLEKAILLQRIKNYPAFFRPWRLITVFTTARCPSLS